MKKIAWVFGVLIVLMIILFYLFADKLAAKAVQKVVPEIRDQLKKNGIALDSLNYGDISVRSPFAVHIDDVRAIAIVDKKNKLSDEEVRSTFNAEKTKLKIRYLPKPAISISVENFELDIPRGSLSAKNPFQRFEEGTWSLNEYLPIRDAKQRSKIIFNNLKQLFDENEVKANFDFEGVTLLKMDSIRIRARLYTHREDGMTSLKFNREDVKNAAKIYEVTLSDEEVSVICDYPLRTFKVLELTYKAKKKSKKEKRRKRGTSEDAFRHVLWSYTLSKEFDTAFAKIVTDAHETLPGNTPQERKMDYLNNSYGRRLSTTGEYSERQIVILVRTDPEIIKYPNEVDIP